MKKKHKIKAIIFDLDGTLLDTVQDIADSMNLALAELGLPEHPVEAYRDFVGNGLYKLVERALPEDKRTPEMIKEVADKFWKIYEEKWPMHTKTYPGILYLIQLCVAHKIKLAILSNKVHYFTKKMIRYFFRGAMINQGKNPFGVYSGEVPGTPDKPDPTRALELAAKLNANLKMLPLWVIVLLIFKLLRMLVWLQLVLPGVIAVVKNWKKQELTTYLTPHKKWLWKLKSSPFSNEKLPKRNLDVCG